MSDREILARIGPDGTVELSDERGQPIAGADLMAPDDAAFLARGLLACATALRRHDPPKPGAVGGDVHLPIVGARVEVSSINGDRLLMLIIPGSIELTFAMTAQQAAGLGDVLKAIAGSINALAEHKGTAH